MRYCFSDSITIGNTLITEQSPTFIIAEAGVNHNGNIEKAKQLVKAAAVIGASAIKFQMFYPDELILKTVEKADYQKHTSGLGSQYEMLKELTLSIEDISTLKDIAISEGISFICTPFDIRSLNELKLLNIDAIKIASTDTTNIPFLKLASQVSQPVIISTAMTYFAEIERAISTFCENNKTNISLLQCTGNYPAPLGEINLRILSKYKSIFECIVGLSDHSIGTIVAELSVAAGAKIIEKHMTLDKTLPGPDHRASMEPDEFKKLISKVRNVELILGREEKILTPSEIKNRKFLQKSIVAIRNIRKGQKIAVDDIKMIRSGGKGISPVYWNEISKMYTQKEISEGQIIEWDDLRW
ncbi:N-acetylneuraminate synthase family protein [Marispirochaeta aestuarii]|uniref:N-acetylneuraminate synthase family protein n=1 Tax=Marispirochaeta aestuarii TaxID=1963862 RepID=UPI002ABE2EB2|nr:N-acetylneuraminate synthase family protein [Marispirochaeta aestuarii]